MATDSDWPPLTSLVTWLRRSRKDSKVTESLANPSAAMVFAGAAGTQQDITVDDNQLVNNGGIVFFNATNVDITNNTSTGSTGSVIFLGGGNSDVLVSGNTASGAPTRTGVSLPAPTGGPNSNVRIIGNSLTGLLNGIGLGF